jgi:hypothetical protein
VDGLEIMAKDLLTQVSSDANLPKRCKQLFERQFSVEQAVRQIVTTFQSDLEKE